jgi:hypothetical protein
MPMLPGGGVSPLHRFKSPFLEEGQGMVDPHSFLKQFTSQLYKNTALPIAYYLSFYLFFNSQFSII